MPVVVNVSCWCGWRSTIHRVSSTATASTAAGATALLRRPDCSTLHTDSSDVSSLLSRCIQFRMCSLNTWLRSKCSRLIVQQKCRSYAEIFCGHFRNSSLRLFLWKLIRKVFRNFVSWYYCFVSSVNWWELECGHRDRAALLIPTRLLISNYWCSRPYYRTRSDCQMERDVGKLGAVNITEMLGNTKC